MPQMIVPQHLGHIGHAHRHARMPGIGLLNRVHRQGTNSVGELPAVRCLHQEESRLSFQEQAAKAAD
jgi:hypothetical protein